MLQQIHFRRYFLTLLGLCFITLPFPVKVHNSTLLMTTTVWLMWMMVNRKAFQFDLRSFLLVSSTFWFVLFSLLYSDDLNLGFARVETKLPALLWPLILLLNRNLHIRDSEFRVMVALLSSVIFLCCIYCHFEMLRLVLIHARPLSDLLFYYEFQTSYLLSPINVHPTYFSIFLIVSIFSMWQAIVVSRPVVKLLLFILLTYHLIFLLQLASRGALLAFIVSMGAILVFKILSSGKKWLWTAGAVALLVMTVTVVSLSDTLRYKFIDSFALAKTDEPASTNSVTLHYRSWVCSLEQLNFRRMIFGVGAGDDERLLDLCYLSHGWQNMALMHLNSHNEYLTLLMRTGLVGLSAMILLLIHLLRRSVKKPNYYIAGIAIVFAVCFVGESIIEVQKGVSSFFLFASCAVHSLQGDRDISQVTDLKR